MSIRFSIPVFLLALVVASLASEIPPPSGDGIVDPLAKLELLYTRQETDKGGLTEGPAVASDGTIYFSDILRGTNQGLILRFDPATGNIKIFAENSHKSNGLIFGPDGYLYAAEGADHGGRRISRWDVSQKERSLVVDNFNGKLFNSPNDLCIDDEGNLYFTDPRYVGHEPRELEYRAVYRVTPAGKIQEITHNLTKPNGIALSPDKRILYVAETNNGSDGFPDKEPGNRGPMRIYAFPIDDNGLAAGQRQTFHDFGSKFGSAGMTIDEHGNLYLATRDPSGPGILVLNTQGDQVAFIPTGAGILDEEEPFTENERQNLENPPPTVSGLPSNVEFGKGQESNMLYVTIDQSLYRIRLKVNGFHHQYAR